MEYTTEVIDRQTGDLVTRSLGVWKTVTELAQDYSVEQGAFRHTLVAMGLLQSEGQHGRRRLSPDAVALGYGKRIDLKKGSKFKYPFDTISPAGQWFIAEYWDETAREVAEARLADVDLAADALKQFSQRRSSRMTVQMQVCWVLDHFPSLTHANVAEVVSHTRQLVDRHAHIRREQRASLLQSMSRRLEASGQHG